jgi:hypothetical protein
MTAEDVLWSREQGFWDPGTPCLDERRVTRTGRLAVLSYRVTQASRRLTCRSTYLRACGTWLLLEHRQTAA